MIKPLSLASYNWKVLVKSLICQFLALVIMIAFFVMVFGGVVNDVLRVISETNLRDFVGGTVTSIMDGSFNSADFTSELNSVLTSLQENIQSIKFPWGGATLSYMIFALTLLVYRLFVSYADVTCACQLEEFMTSNASRPFLWYLFKKQGKTWAFSGLQLLCTVPLDIIILTGALGAYMLFLIAFGWWTIIPVLVIMVVVYAARQTVFGFCLPAIVCEDMSAAKAFRYGISQMIMRFWRVFWKTLIIIFLMVAISVLSIMYISNYWICTAVLTLPNFILFFYLKCINLVEYFEANGRPYFHKRVLIEGTDAYNKHRQRLEKRQSKRSK